jgi:hypothetical protein
LRYSHLVFPNYRRLNKPSYNWMDLLIWCEKSARISVLDARNSLWQKQLKNFAKCGFLLSTPCIFD